MATPKSCTNRHCDYPKGVCRIADENTVVYDAEDIYVDSASASRCLEMEEDLWD
jgi:hypothetical protein